MAIAYFIPDQAKLLAAHSSQTNTSSTGDGVGNGGSGSGNNTTSSSPTTPSHSQPTHNPSGGHTNDTAHHHNHNNHFRANITIPLSAYSATAAHSDVGCWDLLTQIFCHALRFCHESERHPTVIQISLEISNSGPTGDTTVQVGAQAAPLQQQQTPLQQPHQEHARESVVSPPPPPPPSLVVHPTVAPQNASTSTQTQPQNLTAAGVERPTANAAPAAAVVDSRNLEPGTHKPPTKRN